MIYFLSIFNKIDANVIFKIAKCNESLVLSVFTNLRLSYNLIGLRRTMFCVHVAEIRILIAIVNDIGQINGISHQTSSIHEVVGYFKTS